jgi:uncharacterized membrane protein YeiH
VTRSRLQEGRLSSARLPNGHLIDIADLVGTFVFAAEGARTAIRGNLDFFGVMVLSFVTAVGGGIIRDVLLGATPPSALRDWRYGTIAFVAGAATFVQYWRATVVPVRLVVSLDAAGPALFAIAGTEKALSHGMHPFIAVLLGTITGVGGGTIRDVLLAQVPVVLRADLYATAAMAGAVVLVSGRALRWPAPVAASLGGFVCFGLRLVSVWRHWSLPHAGST